MILGKMKIPLPSLTTTLKSGLIACWEFDNSGTSVPDAGGVSGLALSSNGTTQQAGVVGYSNKFANTSYYASLDNANFTSDINNLTRTFSINAWVYFTSFSTETYHNVISSGTYASTNAWNLDSYYTGGNKYIRASFYGAAGYTQGGVVSPSTGIVTYSWFMITATLDGTNIRLYKNGSLIGTSGAMQGTNALNPTQDIYFGIKSNLTSSLTGCLDQTALWNKTLTVSEISMLYNSGNGLAYTNW